MSKYKDIPDELIELWCEQACWYKALIKQILEENFPTCDYIVHKLIDHAEEDELLQRFIGSILGTIYPDFYDYLGSYRDILDHFLVKAE